MDFKNFSELREFIRRYNSKSVLEIGTKKCWQIWETKYSDPLDWVCANAERNYAIRLMLLASAGNPYRHKDISVEEFDNLINVYRNWKPHTISDKFLLDEEAKSLFTNIQKWEIEHEKTVRNWSFKLSDILYLEVIRAHVSGLFIQRIGSFQNAGFGYPYSRLNRTIKFVGLLDRHSNDSFSDEFSKYTKLSKKDYFKQVIACLGVFVSSNKKGFRDFSYLPNIIDEQCQKLGITPENLKIFVKQNSAIFCREIDNSLRKKVEQTLNSVPDFYQPFFYNHFLEVPLIELNNKDFCLPDPFSFTESCWNQVRNIVFRENNRKKLENLLSRAFEDYLKNVLLPYIATNSFDRIEASEDKRADFLIKTPSSYIVLECKNSIMSSDTSAYFQVGKLADLWCRIHGALEQICSTVKAFNLDDKPVIPLIITFYDSIAASSVFQEIINKTDYCSRMGLNMPPIVYSLHEFEHWIADRSLNNWAELIISKHKGISPIQPDKKGHNYQHLNDEHFDFLERI